MNKPLLQCSIKELAHRLENREASLVYSFILFILLSLSLDEFGKEIVDESIESLNKAVGN